MTITVNDSIKLKQLELSDAPDIFRIIDSQREYLRQWLPFVDYTKEVTDTRLFIISTLETSEKSHDYTFVIHLEGKFVGLIGFKDTDKTNQKTEIGYWLSEEYQKRGIVTQSVRRLVEFAFEELGMNRIQIKCATGNIPSKKIPQRLGFSLEGIERDGELLSDGKFTDLEVYSMLKNNFRKLKYQQ